ncbi:MAG: Uma2 family endonuclease [Gemmataceae bacterium]
MTGPLGAGTPTPLVPPLRAGERLDCEEFARRYVAMPELKKAELIEGVVQLPSPVSLELHGEPHAHLMLFLGMYRAFTPGVRVGDNSTVRLDMGNEPQPDALLLIEPRCGGRVRLQEGFIYGGPELAAEVAPSSTSIDRSAELEAYRRNGGQEYLLWLEQEKQIEWYVRRDEQGESFELLAADSQGIVRSPTFSGLWLDVPALLAENLPQVLRTLQLGLASSQHAAFVARLKSSSSAENA